MAKKTTTKKVNKSAIDGKFVSNEEIERHPKTTFRETVKVTTKKTTKKAKANTKKAPKKG